MSEAKAEALFEERYGGSPTRVVRAPGRVNLIGEHVDYAGLPVFPVALQRRVTVHLRDRPDGRITMAHPNREERSFTIGPELVPGEPGDWANHLMAPARHLADRHEGLRGFDGVLSSDVPAAAGLSSSAAVVVAVGLALDAINDLAYDHLDFATEMAEAERFVGTRGGSMDHAISLGAQPGRAARIDFEPLRIRHTPVPAGWRFVVAHSLVRADKSAGAQEAYNDRTRECSEALTLVRRALGNDHQMGYPQLLERHDVIELFALAEWSLSETLLRRFRHVVTEGVRVRRAEIAMADDQRTLFGLLMNASHRSLRDDYQVSAPELDRLCEIALEAGADGARLTGAGFGGCIVALCETGREEALLTALEERFYQGREARAKRSERAFVVEPSGGATVTPA